VLFSRRFISLAFTRRAFRAEKKNHSGKHASLFQAVLQIRSAYPSHHPVHQVSAAEQ
jgi:hypothetical protein